MAPQLLFEEQEVERDSLEARPLVNAAALVLVLLVVLMAVWALIWGPVAGL